MCIIGWLVVVCFVVWVDLGFDLSFDLSFDLGFDLSFAYYCFDDLVCLTVMVLVVWQDGVVVVGLRLVVFVVGFWV